ncbi:laminin subunit alpha-3 [Arapaima gigas]
MASRERRSRSHCAALLLAVIASLVRSARAPVPANEVTGFSLSPPYFNLAEGARISASATCGEDERGGGRMELYCKLVGGPTTGPPSQTIQGQFCDYCNSNDPDRAHPASNAIDGTERWWQSPPLSRGLKYNEVNVTLDLGQLFHVAYVLIKFANSPRPELWVLERSVDFGRTYSPWQYFAHAKRECIETFGKPPNGRIIQDNDQICTTEYSRIVPLENGEIVVSLVNGRPGATNFSYSPLLKDFTKATNIRLRFLRTSTLLGHLISKAQRDSTVTRRYYYSIKDISVGGRCVCHGHAQVCGARNPDNPSRFQCECQHNTCGESCDRCCPGFNQKLWREATSDSANECQPCQCYSHATDCYYDPEVDHRGASLNIYGHYDGGGVCIDCQHNTAGVNCERCVEGYYRPYGVPRESSTGCRPCRCDPQKSNGCEDGSGRCLCKPNFSGVDCERCADGYYEYPRCSQYSIYPTTTKFPAGHIIDPPTDCPAGLFGPPSCQPCRCTGLGVADPVCDRKTGDCVCQPAFEGRQCDLCALGYFNYPYCQACNCESIGAVDQACGPRGQCKCYNNYAGLRCDQCAPGYYSFPSCVPCQCSLDGVYKASCDPVSGQCPCRPGVTGQNCDRCTLEVLIFPQCKAPARLCNPVGSEITVVDPFMGSCRCLANVEGPLCDRCKPLYWNLAAENLNGCIECQCDVKGVLSGVGECQQQSGECHCKPNTCGHTCNTCKNGYFQLQKKNYFGCQGCQCDVGGAIGTGCDEHSGQCQCRQHLEGRTCTEPEVEFYIPSLHHMKYEVEDGSTPNARPVRFGYDPQQFPDMSWRGYATMSEAQEEVRLTVHVAETGPLQFLFVLRFVNHGTRSITGHIRAHHIRTGEGSNLSKEVTFPPSPRPAFLTVPGNGFAEPFSLAPGKWIIHIQAVGVLLDYLVLVPNTYYEASILQEKITEPCTFLVKPENTNKNCLLYRHLPMDGFPSALASLGVQYLSRGEMRQANLHQLTALHPEMASVGGRQAELELMLRVSEPGQYALVLEYASEVDAMQSVSLLVDGQGEARVNIFSCMYSFLCRSVAVDQSNRVAMFQLGHRSKILLQASFASLLLYKVYAIPEGQFSMEYVDPKELCISIHGRFTQDSRYCIPSQYEIPTSALVLNAAHKGTLSVPPVPAGTGGSHGVLLKHPQSEISFNTRVPVTGRYVFLVHFLQLEHPSFSVEVLVDGGRPWLGSINASFCPQVSGCRQPFIAEKRIALQVPQLELTVTLRVPRGKTLILDYILVVPDESYSPELLKEKPLDKSSDFINQCGADSFFINSSSASQFCRDSARCLALFASDGALPCNCDNWGATSPTCETLGGQCPCQPHVIGRQCTRCATGYYGFPYCRRCECGLRLCDEVTGQCICPPHTVKPSCNVCESQTFSYHPLLGCEGCDCSPIGVSPIAGPNCDQTTGQCMCKPRIAGRRCDRCAPGYYGFPKCNPCNCNPVGVRPDVCHPETGRCLCKKNVVGLKCDTCLPGSFHFDETNPNGCTSCFCFGATEQCYSSDHRRGKFVDMLKWRLEMPDREEFPSVFNPASNTVVADVQELPALVYSLHWVAPPSYLGDRVSSYGGFLTYQIKSFGIPSEGMVLLDRRPDVLLHGHHMTLVYLDPHTPTPDRLYQGRVQLLEWNFRHAGTNRPVSREELMMVLLHLSSLRICGLYFSQSQRLTLGEVGLEEVSVSGSGGAASTVEVCSCPPEYRGDSCQRCAPGYYRERNGVSLGRCLPCSCNGLSNDCDEATGQCLNCQYNSAGDHCERCREGYFGDAARKTCLPCPCPFNSPSNSFATGCREVPGGFECFCKPGYTGPRCERCALGYYGDPTALEGGCRPCNCNGNPSSCDPRTGVCNNALEPKDTNTDQQCQECDNCVQTLLDDLERMDALLLKLKLQLESANSSSAVWERLRKLEDAITATKGLVGKYNSSVNAQKAKVAQLEDDMENLHDDINVIKEKADSSYAKGQEAIRNVENTNLRAQDLLSEAQKLFKKIEDLLRQVNILDSSSIPNGDLARMLADAERMVQEMERRSCADQLAAAEKEREEAQKLLDYIKNNITNQYEKNQATANRIAGLLDDYEAKLKDLKEALKETDDTLKKAKEQNRVNDEAMVMLQNMAENLKNEQDKVTGQVSMARDQLRDTANLLKMLEDSKKEYEELAAQLDGAKTDLTKKVNLISTAAAKEDIVERAEEHAKVLSQLAKNLQEAVRNASGSSNVRAAIDAIDAYKNITEAIRAAEEAAGQAKEAADATWKDVIEENLPQKAKYLKERGAKLLEDASDAEKRLNDNTDSLDTLKKRLDEARKKKDALNSDTLAARKELDQINRDDINDMINEAKRTAAAANNTASNTLNKLKAIQDEVDKIKIGPQNANLDKLLNDVDQSVKNLTTTIPSLLEKMSKVEYLTSQLSPSNVSNNIRKIKELIEMARDAANRVVVPMKFSGDGYVELRAPHNVEDLRAFTSLTLFLQRPNLPGGRGDGRRKRQEPTDNGNMFVLYLGNKDATKDYMGMFLNNNMLFYVYKLNGDVYQIKSNFISRSPSEPAFFDRVDLQRIYEDVKINLTQMYTSNKPNPSEIYKSQMDTPYNLFDVDPSQVVFYVGGYPDDFQPPTPLNLPKYQGCMEFSTFNEKFISLYNFQKAINVNKETPCKRSSQSSLSLYFEGTGYARVALSNETTGILKFSQFVHSRSENALLLYIGNEESYCTLTVEKGHVVFRGRNGNNILQTVTSVDKLFPQDEEKELLFVLFKNSNALVRLGNTDILKNLNFRLKEFETYYIGGLPSSLRQRVNITAPPLKGCLRGIRVNSGPVELREKVGISQGCPSDFLVSRKAEFSLKSSLSAPLDGFSLADGKTVSLGFQSMENQGLLMENGQLGNGFELSLANGFVILKFNDKILKSRKTYTDGQWHYLTITRNKDSLELRVDEDDLAESQPSSSSVVVNEPNVTLGSGTFQGCLGNLYTRRPSYLFRPEDLSQFTATGDVLLDICSVARPPLMMLAGHNNTVSIMKNETGDEASSGCRLPALFQHCHQLGSPVSYLSYSFIPQVLQDRPQFSLDFRTKTANGLLLYIGSVEGTSYLALYLSNGRVRLAVGRKQLFIREKCNNGKWHTVMFSWKKRKLRLVMDGLHTKEGHLTLEEGLSTNLQPPVYLGTVPTFVHTKHEWKTIPRESVTGCFCNFKLNSQPVGTPTFNHGAAPCFDGPTESGAYFSGQGGYVILENSFVVGFSFELVFEVRPRNLTGIVFHVGSSHGHHLSLFMRKGEVIVQVNNGAGQFGVSVTPQQPLCDGTFHRVAVIKRNNVVQLDVDTEGQYTVGPSSSTFTNTSDPLYVGGVPEASHQLKLPVRTSLVGCVQNVRVNGERISFNKVAQVSGPVNLRECPAG